MGWDGAAGQAEAECLGRGGAGPAPEEESEEVICSLPSLLQGTCPELCGRHPSLTALTGSLTHTLAGAAALGFSALAPHTFTL